MSGVFDNTATRKTSEQKTGNPEKRRKKRLEIKMPRGKDVS